MANEHSQRQTRSEKTEKLALQQAVADLLRRLPEFQTRSEERIQTVSRALAEALAQAVERLGKS